MKTKTNNERKHMLTCPYCLPLDRKPIKNGAGFSMHIMRAHPHRWKKTLEASLPPGYIQERPAPAVAKKGQKKVPIPMDCPGCDYHTGHPPAMARHIQTHHPEIWKGSLSKTLGRKVTRAGQSFLEMADMPKRRGRGNMIDPSTLTPKRAEELRLRRIYEAKRRKKFKRLGFSATGRPYKQQSRTLTLTGPELVEAKTVNIQRKIEPSVYHAPFEIPVKECPHCNRPFPAGVIWRANE